VNGRLCSATKAVQSISAKIVDIKYAIIKQNRN
jgi:hypothetical protein